ncbi:hypothetical protein [Actinomadura sp. SCN-SB]|uniref:hypothetical protein n=1 Tax=Actinomadura sp. SCN-SB TaxID=3373092 RepID=UPI003753248F
MPSFTRLQKMARDRQKVTGEEYQTALQELRTHVPNPALIPRAAVGQAGFEASLLDLLGQIDISLWPTGTPAWGFTRLTPRLNELVAEFDRRCLIDFIKEIMPCDGGDAQVYGYPGLRIEKAGNGVALLRPGPPGRLILRVSWSDWNKAAAIARQELAEDHEGQPPAPFWVERPQDWHPRERAYVAQWPGRHDSTGPFYRNASPLSVLLRHLIVWNGGTNLDYIKLWTNGAMHDGHAYPIHFAWANGPTHPQILALLQDPIFCRDEQLGRLMSRCRCYQGACWLTLRLATGNKLFLRRDTEPVRLTTTKLPDREHYRRRLQRRAAFCADHGLPGPFDNPTSPTRKHGTFWR